MNHYYKPMETTLPVLFFHIYRGYLSVVEEHPGWCHPKEKWKTTGTPSHDKTTTDIEKGKIQYGTPVIKGWGTRELTRANTPILQLRPGHWMGARLELTLFWYRRLCFCCVNLVVRMLTTCRCFYMTKAERSVSKQGELQPCCHSKARSVSWQL